MNIDFTRALSPPLRTFVRALIPLVALIAAVLGAASYAESRMDARAQVAVAPVAAQVQHHEERLDDHEQRLREIEEMKADVRWIRHAIEKQERE